MFVENARKLFIFHWKPGRDLVAVLASWVLVVGALYPQPSWWEPKFGAGFFTRNIFILWPVFQPMGQLVTLVKDGLDLPLLASLGFIEALIGMIVLVWLAGRYAKKHAT